MHRYQKIGLAGVLTFTFGILLQFVIVPPIVKSMMKKKIALKKGWPMRETWTKLPFTMETHIYLFNVTNHREIDEGAKPIIQELGPFVYDQYQEKIEQTDHEEDDTVSYVLKNVYHFNRQKSAMSDETLVYFPHTYIMTASAAGGNMERGAWSSFASRSVDALLGNPSSFFFNSKVKTILFDGLPIPCSGASDFFEKLTCNLLDERYFDLTLRKDGDTYYTSLFGFMNGTYDKKIHVRINRGIKSLKDVGKVVEVAGMKNLSVWKDDKCNVFEGTDGLIFPPFSYMKSSKEDLIIVNQFLCRKLRLTYNSDIQYSGLKLQRYTVDIGTDGEHVPEEKCYCITPDRCLRKGMFESFRCTNTPVIISNPHFYLADPYYLSTVDTLKPDREKHLSYIDFDALSGAPVRAHVRVQLNMELMKIMEFRLMRNHTYAMLPLVWRDEITILPDFLIDEIKFGHMQVMMAKIMEFTMMIGGLATCAVAAYLNYQSRKVKEIDLKPTNQPENSIKVDSDEIESSRSTASGERTATSTPRNNE